MKRFSPARLARAGTCAATITILAGAPVAAQERVPTAGADRAPGTAAPRGIEIVPIPTPLPLPGQLKPLEAPIVRPSPPPNPRQRVGAANVAARMEPDRTAWLNAIQQYPFADGALYQIYAAPGQVTDIELQEGEELVGTGPVAAGDTVRWVIGDTVSGTGSTKRVHILLKPTRPDLATNLVINTDRRTYHLELRATPSTYMAAVSWTYPQDQLIALRASNAEREKQIPVAAGINVTALNFRYRIDGDKAPWRPVRAFDDGRQAFIEFPETVGTTDMPPLFVIGPSGAVELVNYRVQGRYMVVDRLFAVAELRLGAKKSERRVRIQSDDGRRVRRS